MAFSADHNDIKAGQIWGLKGNVGIKIFVFLNILTYASDSTLDYWKRTYFKKQMHISLYALLRSSLMRNWIQQQLRVFKSHKVLLMVFPVAPAEI